MEVSCDKETRKTVAINTSVYGVEILVETKKKLVYNHQQPQFHLQRISKFLYAHKSIIIICIDNEKK